MVKIVLIKSPDEWAAAKQACRDELVIYLFFSSHNIDIFNIYRTIVLLLAMEFKKATHPQILRTSAFSFNLAVIYHFAQFSFRIILETLPKTIFDERRLRSFFKN